MIHSRSRRNTPGVQPKQWQHPEIEYDLETCLNLHITKFIFAQTPDKDFGSGMMKEGKQDMRSIYLQRAQFLKC